jgi:ribosomal protein L7/L12
MPIEASVSPHPDLPLGEAERGGFRLVVLSIGTANPRLRTALRHVLPLPDAEIARLLYQAPSKLLGGLDREAAERMSELLRSTGLETAVLGRDEPFMAGQGEHEVALALRDVSRLPAVAQLVAEVLDTDLATAAQTVWASPAMLVGNVSAATVEALRRRFAPLGVELDVSQPAAAVFDLFLGRCPAAVLAHARRALVEAGAEPAASADAPEEMPLLAAGITWEQASSVWERLHRTGAPVRLLNRELQRFDVRLDAAPATAEMLGFLAADTGMPLDVARKVVGGTPIVLHQNVPFERARACLEEIARRGGAASAHLLAFQTFHLIVEQAPDRAAVARLLAFGAGLSAERAAAALERLPFEVEEPLTPVRARWLQGELKQTGARALLVLQ